MSKSAPLESRELRRRCKEITCKKNDCVYAIFVLMLEKLATDAAEYKSLVASCCTGCVACRCRENLRMRCGDGSAYVRVQSSFCNFAVTAAAIQPHLCERFGAPENILCRGFTYLISKAANWSVIDPFCSPIHPFYVLSICTS